MAVTVGTLLGVYEILAKIGAGGMGEVYRAHDRRLNRDVAIKILPDAFAHDPERVARFRREAQILAGLNHPGIAQVHGFEEASSTGSGQAVVCALVMELVEGEDLAHRIARGALPLDEVLYKAKDTRLDRVVAIKVLAPHIAERPESRQRFEREARAVAVLNHPHICVLHDIGRHDDTTRLTS